MPADLDKDVWQIHCVQIFSVAQSRNFLVAITTNYRVVVVTSTTRPLYCRRQLLFLVKQETIAVVCSTRTTDPFYQSCIFLTMLSSAANGFAASWERANSFSKRATSRSWSAFNLSTNTTT